ncbi:hypothetical protein FRC01_001036 [Tulasnella sp. 417]|nr:hypothetical protein FRC01_001036 [Tulasnella sp. 417]
MFSNFDARKSWQKATKFREHLSLNTQQQQQQQQSPQEPPNTKSAWSPITPSESGHSHFTLMSSSEPVPPVPPIPAIHASHLAPVERDPDEQRSIERARAEAAAALERGSRERQLERERLDRERQLRLLEKERQQQAAASASFFNVNDDAASGRGPVASLAPSSFTSKSKAAWARLSRAVFRLTTSPGPGPSSPYPRDSMAASSFIPRRLTDLSPWPPLNVSEKEREAAAGVHHHHYYGVDGGHSRSHSRAGSQDEYTAAEDHMHRDLGDVEKGRTTRCQTCYTEHKKSRRRSTIWCILLFLLILALIGNIVFLNIRVLTKNADVENPAAGASNSTFNPSSSAIAVVQPTTTIPKGVTVTRSGTATATSAASASSGVPAAVSSCLSQFTSSSTSPASYPCGDCVPILSAIPNDLSSSSSTSITGQGNILQFCALQAINAGLSSSSASALTSVGWMKDTKPCTWQGVSCDGQGRINQLELVAPGVPTTMPDEVQFL